MATNFMKGFAKIQGQRMYKGIIIDIHELIEYHATGEFTPIEAMIFIIRAKRYDRTLEEEDILIKKTREAKRELNRRRILSLIEDISTRRV